jgi:hypothetical protein
VAGDGAAVIAWPELALWLPRQAGVLMFFKPNQATNPRLHCADSYFFESKHKENLP